MITVALEGAVWPFKGLSVPLKVLESGSTTLLPLSMEIAILYSAIGALEGAVWPFKGLSVPLKVLYGPLRGYRCP
jgi:hypothetical protein